MASSGVTPLVSRGTAPSSGIEFALDVAGIAHRLIERFGAERRQHAEAETPQQRQRQVQQRLRPRGLQRRFGAIDDRHIVGRDAAGDTDLLLVALQQPVIKRAVGVHFALQEVVLDAAVTCRSSTLAFSWFTFAASVSSRSPAPPGSPPAAEALHVLGFGVDAGARRLVDLCLQLQRRRIAGTEQTHLILVLRLELGLLFAQGLDRRVRQDLRQVHARRRAGLHATRPRRRCVRPARWRRLNRAPRGSSPGAIQSR